MYNIEYRLRSNELFAMETERLRLAVLKRSCARMVTEYLVRNREFHKKWSQTHEEGYFTERTQKEYLKYDTGEYLHGRLVPLYIFDKEHPDRILGRVSFFNFAYGGMMSCSVGYHLDERETGKGIMTEALTESCAMIMDTMNIHRIEAFILPDNEKSLALIKRCGFRHEGRRISYMHINGRWEDHEAFYLLDDSKNS
ncbi:MAG: GNAT family N-acetyltransferase [Clostridiales bacterium]|nr:GNAT family N-acetyltransferase [Clostridiales bacterium]